jgi:hypothetical protein
MKADQHTRTVDVRDQAGNVVGSKEVVLYAGLLSQAHEKGLARVRTSILQIPTEENGRLAIIKAEVETGKGLFEALGDASPENVDEQLAPHLIRVAETRAKARALRDAVNVGVVSFEELDGVRLKPDGGSPGSGSGPAASSRPGRSGRLGSSTRPRSPASRDGHSGNGSAEQMTEAQRRYLFRLLAGQGYQGKAAEEFLYAELDVRSLAQVNRSQASALIDQLLQSSPPEAATHGASSPQR